jgi:hypothetical protein
MTVEQLLELRPTAAALGAGAAAIGQLFDRRGAASDLVVDGVVGDRPAMAHVHIARLGQPDLDGQGVVVLVVLAAVVVVEVPGASVMVMVLIVTFLVGGPSPLDGKSCPMACATSRPCDTVPIPA